MWDKIIQMQNRESRVLSFMKEFKVSELLYKCGCIKEKGVSMAEIFTFLINLVFTGKNLFRAIETGQSNLNKDPVYRFLNSVKVNWERFLLLLAKKAYDLVRPLTNDNRADCLVLDDTLFDKSRSSKLELLARVFDHVTHKYKRGFRCLTLGWTDGNTFFPLLFNLLSSQDDKNIICGVDDKIDKRTNGYKARKRSRQNTLDVSFDMIKKALECGFAAKYLLCDSWFSFACFIKKVTTLNLNVICMMKDAVNQFYKHNGKIVRLSTLYANITKTRRVSKNGNVYFATVVVDMIVATNVTIPVKITFLEAIGKKREWVAVCSTDTTISDEEMVRIYGKRWSIEVFFKTVKSELAFAKEFQGRSFDMLFAHTTIVYVRYILLAVECRRNADGRTMGELFYLMIDELTDIKLDESVKILVESMLKAVGKSFDPSDEAMRDFCSVFMGALPANLRGKLVLSDRES